VIALYLESNRKATQSDVHEWLEKHGSVEINLSDPYPNPNDVGYWSQTYNATFDASSFTNDSYNVRGNGSLRGAIRRVLANPFASNAQPSVSGVKLSGISFRQI